MQKVFQMVKMKYHVKNIAWEWILLVSIVLWSIIQQKKDQPDTNIKH